MRVMIAQTRFNTIRLVETPPILHRGIKLLKVNACVQEMTETWNTTRAQSEAFALSLSMARDRRSSAKG